jgi:hypothetical protein
MSIAEEAKSTERRSVNDERAAIAANQPQGPYNRRRSRWFRLHVRAPKTADGWSKALAIIMAIGVPVWGLASYLWGSATPKAGIEWIVAVPWAIALVYSFVQIFFLLASAGHSDNLGISDWVISGLSLLSVFGTGVIILVLGIQGSFPLGLTKILTWLAMFMATAGEFLITGWMRFLVNRRYFTSVTSSPGGGSHDGSS